MSETCSVHVALLPFPFGPVFGSPHLELGTGIGCLCAPLPVCLRPRALSKELSVMVPVPRLCLRLQISVWALSGGWAALLGRFSTWGGADAYLAHV